MRADVFDIAEHAVAAGLRTVMSPNGTLVTREVAARMKACGIARISVSIDFPTAEEHDRFRGVPGCTAVPCAACATPSPPAWRCRLTPRSPG